MPKRLKEMKLHHYVATVLVIVGIVLALGIAFGWFVGTHIDLKNDTVKVQRSTGLEQGAKVSKEFWGTVCGGQVSTTFVPLADGIAGQATAAVDQETGNATQCSVAITTKQKFKPRTLCAIKVHEDGHLAGKGHSSDPNNIMYPKITAKNIPAACFRVKG